MKINYLKILAYWLMLMVSVCGVLWLTSCATPNPKKQKKHYEKFVYYGGTIKNKVDTLWQYDTSYVDGEPVIDSFPIPCICPEPVIDYKDRWHTRRMDKRERDSLKHIERILKLKFNFALKMNKENGEQVEQANEHVLKMTEELTKQIKYKNKNERKTKTAPWKMIIVILGLVALILLLLKFR